MSAPPVRGERASAVGGPSRFDQALAEDEYRWTVHYGRPDRTLPSIAPNTTRQPYVDWDSLDPSVERVYSSWDDVTGVERPRGRDELAAYEPTSSLPTQYPFATSRSAHTRLASYEYQPEHRTYHIRRAHSPSPEDGEPLALDESQPGHAHHLASRTERESSPYPFYRPPDQSLATYTDPAVSYNAEGIRQQTSFASWTEPTLAGPGPLPPPPSRSRATLFPPRPPGSLPPFQGGPPYADRQPSSQDRLSDFNSHAHGALDRLSARPTDLRPQPRPNTSVFSYPSGRPTETGDEEWYENVYSNAPPLSASRLRPVLPSLGIDLSSPPSDYARDGSTADVRASTTRRVARARAGDGWAGWGPEMGSDFDEDEADMALARAELDWATRPSEAEAVRDEYITRSRESVIEKAFVTEIRCGGEIGRHPSSSSSGQRTALALSPTYLLPNPHLSDGPSTSSLSQQGCNALLVVHNAAVPILDFKFASLGSVGRGGGPSRTTYEAVFPIVGNLAQTKRVGLSGEGHSSRCGCRDKREIECLNWYADLLFNSTHHANADAISTYLRLVIAVTPLASTSPSPASSTPATRSLPSTRPRATRPSRGSCTATHCDPLTTTRASPPRQRPQ